MCIRDSRKSVLEKIKELGDTNLFNEIFPISALLGDGVDEMLSIIKKYLPKRKKKVFIKKNTSSKKRYLLY